MATASSSTATLESGVSVQVQAEEGSTVHKDTDDEVDLVVQVQAEEGLTVDKDTGDEVDLLEVLVEGSSDVSTHEVSIVGTHPPPSLSCEFMETSAPSIRRTALAHLALVPAHGSQRWRVCAHVALAERIWRPQPVPHARRRVLACTYAVH